jgi:hypothetical protein
MELKHLITQCTYRIESKPGGGFIAHPTDPTVAPLEAPTREELQQEIQAKIAAVLAEEFPGLKFPLESKQLKLAFHIEPKPGGGFVIHSSDPDTKPIEGATHAEVESHFAEKLLGFVGKHFAPELAQALAAQGSSGDIKVFVDRKTSVAVNTSSCEFELGTSQRPLSVGTIQPSDVKMDGLSTGTPNANSNNICDGIANVAITPESNGPWIVFRFLLALLIIGTLMYFFLHYSR